MTDEGLPKAQAGEVQEGMILRGTGTPGALALIRRAHDEDRYGRIMMCVDAWTSTWSDDGPEPYAAWREPPAAEQQSAEYARLAESTQVEQELDELRARNRAAERSAVQERMEQTGEAQEARAEYERMPRTSDDLSVVTQEDMDRIGRIFDW